jgi:oligoendopeptidase F
MALDHGQEMELRGYSSPIQPTNIGNEIPDEAVEHLMAVTEANYGLAQEYFRLKAGMLGIDRLRNTDVYAPVVESERKYGFDEARDMVVASYADYDPDFGRIVGAFFDERRVDVMPRTGKSGGAFAMGISPEAPPFLLLNYTGTLRDLATIAHEAGHGLHFVLSQKQNLLNYHAPLPLAETASVFGEMLLTRALLDKESDPTVRRSLLCAKIEDIIATTFRQTVLTRFELRLHAERMNGLLSSDRIGEIWLEENGRLFGDAVEMIPAYRWGWSYISHFIHTRFYCYSYTFAELMVLALFQKYREEGDSFKPGYRRLLESGGALSPADTAQLAGIDITEGDFWQKGYDFLGGLIAELKATL